MKNAFYTSLLLLLFASCTANQKVKFNKNWSGSVETTVDFTDLYKTMGDEPSPTLMEDTSNIRKMDRLKRIKGISKVKVESRGRYVTVLSYKFKNLEALNLSGNLLYNDVDYMKTTFFKVENNELFFSFPNQEEMGSDDLGMGDLFFYNLEIETEGPVREAFTGCDTLVQTNSKVVVKTSLTQLIANSCRDVRITMR
ncbi:MAG: hypothetical protein K0R65_568 [Crocinitomicaceae bacterium]|jgi:hypothetical protein|nr:hypothetical protein [Crocinitomicaceae bacterium]